MITDTVNSEKWNEMMKTTCFELACCCLAAFFCGHCYKTTVTMLMFHELFVQAGLSQDEQL